MGLKTIDARGMACPLPVINTKKALEALTEGTVTTIVDNDAARENLIALAKSMGLEVAFREEGSDYHLTITKKGEVSTLDLSDSENTVVFVTSSEFGRGSSELANVLMKSFMFTLVESDTLPQCLIFVNSGVSLTCEDSPVIEHLVNLKDRGVEILSCGTCLDYFNLKEKLNVGVVSNMYTIYEKMNGSGKVITI